MKNNLLSSECIVIHNKVLQIIDIKDLKLFN